MLNIVVHRSILLLLLLLLYT